MEKKQQRIYISGKISGLDMKVAENYFETVEKQLQTAGHIPVNPMKVVEYHPDHTWHHYMAKDIEALLYCDAILMLDNWTDSKGAKIEHGIAVGLGIPVYYTKNHDLF